MHSRARVRAGLIVVLVVLCAAVSGCRATARAPATCGPSWTALRSVPAGPVAGVGIESADRGRVVGAVVVDGPVSAEQLSTRPGMMIDQAPIADDVRALWALGVSDDVRVELEDGRLTFVMAPRPKVVDVSVVGDRVRLARFALLRDTPFDPARVSRMAVANRIANERAGYRDAVLTVEQQPRAGGVALCVVEHRGPKIRIRSVRFPGSHRIDEATLLATLQGSKTLVNRPGGVYDPEAFEVDHMMLSSLYWDRGMTSVTVGPPRVRRDGDKLDLEIPIVEGKVFRQGRVQISNHADLDLGLVPGAVFSRAKVLAAEQRLAAHTGSEVEFEAAWDGDRLDLTFTVKWRWPWDAWRSLLSPGR